MGINNCIQFGKNLFFKTHVLEKSTFNPFIFNKKDAYIVELALEDTDNIKLLNNLSEKWKDGEFTKFITSTTALPNRRVYAITSEVNELNAKNIYGLADFKFDNNKAILSFLQASPEQLGEQKNIKSIGRSLLTSLCEPFAKHGITSIETFARPKEKPFYKAVFPHLQEKYSTQDSYTNIVINLTDDSHSVPKASTENFQFYF